MPQNGIRSPYSQAPFQIALMYEEEKIGEATAFCYQIESDLFLVTNRHCVIGGSHLMAKTASYVYRSFGARAVSVHSYTWDKDTGVISCQYEKDSAGTFRYLYHPVSLYSPNHTPLWFEHPTLGKDCDVIAIPWQRPTCCPSQMHIATNLISNKSQIPVIPGGQVFLTGYPAGISVGPGLPIWKSGYIASEPHFGVTVNAVTLPAFFIDAQTRPGLSGSPCFATYSGMWDTNDPYGEINIDSPNFWQRDDVVLYGESRQFVGIYSGRLEKEDSLGLVWREDVIRLICESRCPPSDPDQESTIHRLDATGGLW